jgi:hypothetical protein
VRHHAARTLCALAAVFALALVAAWPPDRNAAAATLRWRADNRAAERTVVLAGAMSEDETVQLTAALAASGNKGPVLFHSPQTVELARAHLQSTNAEQVIAVGNIDCAGGYKLPVAARLETVAAAQEALFEAPTRAVVAPAGDRRLVLHAACLAGALQAPLLLTDDKTAPDVKKRLAAWKVAEIHVVGGTAKLLGKTGAKVTKLPDEDAVVAAYVKQLVQVGPVRTIVLANPDDLKDGYGRMSTLAPWLALQKRAALVLTNSTGENAEEAVAAALKRKGLERADTLLIAGNLKAIPMKKRPNPVKDGRDRDIEMEPMTPDDDQPCSFATGRLFHEDRGVLSLMLARQRHLEFVKQPKALIVSNPGGGLPLLETFSRNTTNEFKNAGYDTTAYFGNEASKEAVKRGLPDANVFLWEGHHSTLVSSYGIPQWKEPLQPSLVFLQSCLALTESKAHPFLQRGAVAVIGSSTRTYSGSGGAFSLAFFDTLLYEDATLGGSLRQAKNFMLAFAQLKQRRFGEQSKLGGANVRSAWAFTLWGDPTVKMPRPTSPEGAVAPVKHVVQGNTITLMLPDDTHDKVESAKYHATVPANARLAGLVRKEEMADRHQLVPFVFAEVQLPKAVAGKTPHLKTKLPETHWVFCYDERCQRGYLLVTPRAKDQGELRFQVAWE